MNIPRRCIHAIAAVAMSFSFVAAAQQVEQDVPVLSEDIAGRLDGFSFKEGPESSLEFRGTPIALGAEGEAEVEFQDGRTRVDVDVDDLPNPASLGPFATYVLWAVTSDGNASNLGSIEVRNGDGSLEATTPLSQFGLIVSAEPHFAVTVPSRAIVLQNLGKRVQGQKFNIPGLKQRIDYSALTIQPRDESTKTSSDLTQARYALAIAEGADADRLAAREYGQAADLLARAEAAHQDKKYSVRNQAPLSAREAVQIAEDARRKAVTALAKEQSEAAARAARESAEQKAATEAALAAEEARRREEQAVSATSSAARADLIARLNRALPTRETPRGIVAELAGVEFATGAATLSARARESLARFAGIVGVYPSLRILVEGHTDSTGSLELNRTLSYERALAVRDYLKGQGVTDADIEVTGRGPDVPVASNDTREGRARNRRVEIILSGDLVKESR
jgi:outer membrane protein OmpA-like peptidoglycan-associated protein